ncbi:MAG: hypothetical protein ABI036_02680, partial [Fibrobacteria bacterium]
FANPAPTETATDATDATDAANAADAAVGKADASASLYHAFRHGLHELSMALFPLRALYQAYWEKLAKEEYPHDLLMGDPDYGRAIVENFFWDHFVQYSDARPILRTARELEGKELRLAHDMMQWSYAPLWFYRVQERTDKSARLINLGNLKTHTVLHGGRIPGDAESVLTRILPFRGKEFCGHGVLAFGKASAASGRLEALFRAGCRELGLKSSVTMRPDVHCDEWRRHGAVFLALWRAEVYDSTVGKPMRNPGASPVFNLALRSREALLSELAAAPDAEASGPGSWQLGFRSMRLSKLEAKGGNLLVTVADPAFRAYVRDWLRDNLGSSLIQPEGVLEALPDGSAASQDAWLHTASDSLNGQTPIQASTHDLGRRRLLILLQDMLKQGRDTASLRRQLGI